MKTHKDLDVWKKSVDFVTDIYNITKKFPKEEIYCLTSQIRRAAISIPSNISEGAARNHKKEFIQFLYIALGSLTELETQLIIAANLSYLDKIELERVTLEIVSIRKMLSGLINSIERRS